MRSMWKGGDDVRGAMGFKGEVSGRVLEEKGKCN